MALIVEDGTGLANADAYVSLADADAYFVLYREPTEWEESYDPVREEAIRMATQYLDTHYAARWEGGKTTRTQALSWPRVDVYDDARWLVASNVLPKKLKDATCEAALEHIKRASTGGLQPTLTDSSTIAKERTVIGGAITEEIEYMSPKEQAIYLPVVEGFLRDFIGSASTVSLWRT